MIYIVRHGQTDWNLIDKLQGRADIPLNETGVNQAKAIAEKLKNLYFDVVFCSPLKRAKQTCEIINKDKINFDDRLLERDFGEYEGFKKSDFDYEGFWNSTKNQKFIKAESIFDVEKRIYNFLDEISTKYKNKNVLVVCHGGVGIVAKTYYDGKPKNGDYLQTSHGNGEAMQFKN